MNKFYTLRSLIRRARDPELSFIRRRKGNPPIPYHYTIYYYITRDETQRLQRVRSLLPKRGEGCIHSHLIHLVLFRLMHIIFHSKSFENLIWCNCRAKEWEWRGTTFPSYRGVANGRIRERGVYMYSALQDIPYMQVGLFIIKHNTLVNISNTITKRSR